MIEKKIEIVVGEDLYGLSIDELDERISMLKTEILRLEREKQVKKQERAEAEQLFGPKS